MNWAQIIMVAIITFNVVTDIMHDGEERVRKFDATKTMLAAIVQVSLLNWGGFFDCWFK